MTAFSVMSLCLLLSPVALSDVKVLEKSGDWELLREDDPFAGAGECVIRSVSKERGGRRERPRFRVALGDGDVIVDPDKDMTLAITAYRQIRQRRGDDIPDYASERTLVHKVRIDKGAASERAITDPEHVSWQASPDLSDEFVDLLRERQDLSIPMEARQRGTRVQVSAGGISRTPGFIGECLPVSATRKKTDSPGRFD